MTEERHSPLVTHEEREPDLQSGDPYAVLGLDKAASQAEIKRAYFALIRQHPPESDVENFKLIRAAYEKLKTAERRAETDLFLLQPPPPWEPTGAIPAFNPNFQPADVLLALRRWGDLGRTDFQDDFGEIKL
jgi:curved DNA-binding protein CbpA